MIHFVPVDNPELIQRTADLARLIWSEHYPPLIGPTQTEYMLTRFQTPQAIVRQVQGEGLKYWLVTEEVRDRGYFAVQLKETELFLSKFYLEKGARGTGLARKMMTFVEELASEAGLLRIVLNTHKKNIVALKAYEGLGFKIASPIVTDIGEGYVMDDYRLEKELI